MVYSKTPFAGPEAVLAYLSLYTHRVAISNGLYPHSSRFAAVTGVEGPALCYVREITVAATSSPRNSHGWPRMFAQFANIAGQGEPVGKGLNKAL